MPPGVRLRDDAPYRRHGAACGIWEIIFMAIPHALRSRAVVAAGASVAAAAVVLAGLPGQASALTTAAPVAAPAPAAALAAEPGDSNGTGAPRALDLAGYTRQVIDWQPCFPPGEDLPPGVPADVRRLQCGSFAVPMDWKRPSSSPAIQIAVSKLPTTTQPAQGATFTNPGGPGGPGLFTPLAFLLAGRTALLNTQDVYGIDVRGTGASTNVTCGNFSPASLEPRNRSKANLELILDQAALGARVCDSEGGALMDNITTENTVRDLDLLRRLINRPKINWIGYSGGTWLGAHYATFFPKQTGRFVLDSANEFTALWQKTFIDNQPPGFERRFRADWLPWVAKYNSVFGLGTSAEKVRLTYERVRAAVSKAPIDLPEVTVDGPAVDNLIAGSLYNKGGFQQSAEALSALRAMVDAGAAGAGATAAMARADLTRHAALLKRAKAQRGKAPVGLNPVALDAGDATFLGIACNDTPWTYTRSSIVKRTNELGAKYPLQGWARVGFECVHWKRPAVKLPKVTGKGLPPMLIVQSERDPATPLEGAQRATAATAGTRMLLVRGEGDHALYAGDNECVDRAVEAFINTGKLPAKGATCQGMPLPAPTAPQLRRSAGTVTPAGVPVNPLERLRQLNQVLER
jgi:pimeloyl-ACP methyl ester carboxylesterase